MTLLLHLTWIGSPSSERNAVGRFQVGLPESGPLNARQSRADFSPIESLDKKERTTSMKMSLTAMVRLGSRQRKNQFRGNKTENAAVFVILGLLPCLASGAAVAQSCLSASARGDFMNPAFAAPIFQYSKSAFFSLNFSQIRNLMPPVSGVGLRPTAKSKPRGEGIAS